MKNSGILISGATRGFNNAVQSLSLSIFLGSGFCCADFISMGSPDEFQQVEAPNILTAESSHGKKASPKKILIFEPHLLKSVHVLIPEAISVTEGFE